MINIEYKIHKSDGMGIPCNDCYCRVPTTAYLEGQDILYYCEFCFNTVGDENTSINKQSLAQMMNTLFKKLKEK